MDSVSVYSFAGMHYGVPVAPDGPVVDAGDIHWLPQDSQWLAGLTVCAGQTLSLFDLPAGLGLSPIERGPGRYRILCPEAVPGSALLVAEREKIFAGKSFPTEKLPAFLRSETVDRCIRHGHVTIPVVNSEALLRRLVVPGFRPGSARFQIPRLEKCRENFESRYVSLSFGDGAYAISADVAVTGGLRAKLALRPFRPAPAFVAGVCCETHPVTPVIDLARRLSLEPAGMPTQFLEVQFGGQHFRFLVEAVGQTIAEIDLPPLPMPPLLRTAWRPAALLGASKVYPLLDPVGLLALPPRAKPETIRRQAYRPESQFQHRFQRESLEVVEFELGGFCHALPAMETGEPIAAAAIRPLSVSNPLVIGIAPSGGRLLPVLDLGGCFGIRPATQGWMIPVSNGDFQALVLTPKVHGKRRLTTRQQRRLPFESTENLVYGCYPHSDRVRLIFNAHALAVNFDPARHLRILESLAGSAAMEADAPARSEAEYSGPDSESLPGTDAASAQGSERPTEPVRPSEEKNSRRRVRRSKRNREAAAIEPPLAGAESVTAAGHREGRKDPDTGPDPSGSDTKNVRLEKRQCIVHFQFDLQRSNAGPQPPPSGRVAFPLAVGGNDRLPAVLQDSQRPAEGITALQLPIHAMMSRPLQRHSPPYRGCRPALPGPASAAPAERNNASTEDAVSSPRLPRPEPNLPDPRPRQSAAVAADAVAAPADAAEAPALKTAGPVESISTARDAADTGSLGDLSREAFRAEPRRASGRSNQPVMEDAPVYPDPESRKAAPGTTGPACRRWFLIAASLAGLCLALWSWFDGREMSPPATSPKTRATAPPRPAASVAVSRQNARDLPAENTSPAKVSGIIEGQSESTVPNPAAERTVQIRITDEDGRTRIYEVKRGDTLWGISERYTGSGFNYPDVARENRIPNPDLIYPRQKIKVE